MKDQRNNSTDAKSPPWNLNIEDTMNIRDMGDWIRDYKLDAISSIGGSCWAKAFKNDEEKKFYNRGAF